MSTAHANRLINETSPYLLQHAHNPVDWFPWGEEALEKARREDKPILLSVGYSACHWCHVMEHESFEDPQVAAIMNELFVCIKVDREERPDLDKIYQTAHQVLSQRSGGWPLNMFLTPDQMPFFGGTYFPKTPRYGMPAFPELLREIASIYRDKRSAIDEQNVQLRDVFARLAPQAAEPGDHPAPAVFEDAFYELSQQFDRTHGGFGGAPKFPHPTSLALLLALYRRGAASAARALEIVVTSLSAMASRGLYDHVGGGFFRYCVDERWAVPHFEKMLYDNAQLLPLYADAWQLTGNEQFRTAALDTGAWIMREMQAPEGGYYSTLDADSEGHEGKFYVWSEQELRQQLNDDEYRALAARFGLDGAPNFEGQWHLNIAAPLDIVAAKLGRSEADVSALLESARTKLFSVRAGRVRPGRDEKILTSWNGLLIAGMAHAGRVLGRDDLIASAERAFDFARSRLWQDRRLRATYKDGRARFAAYLDDYAALVHAALALLQARWRDGDLGFALELAQALIEHFEDEAHGGFFFTADDHERLVYRPKPVTDDALPAGNGLAALALLRLGHLVGDLNLLHAAENAVDGLYAQIRRHPSASAALLIALDDYLDPIRTVILRGNTDTARTWLRQTGQTAAGRQLAFAIPDNAKDLPGVLAARVNRADVTAYVCTGHECQAPVTTLEAFTALLNPAPPA
jgi:uncharacterized protein YyaL (SSP411 family)